MKKIFSWLCFAVIIIFLAIAPVFFGKKKSATPRSESTVLVMWHVDTFEGGTGSRQDFLMKSAIAFEKQNSGVYVSVIKHTEDSVATALQEGKRPDLISFGCGVYDVADFAKPLKTRKNNAFFAAASIGEVACFYPYAFGMYVEISLQEKEQGDVIVSKGRHNLPLFAAVGYNVVKALEPIEAYTQLVGGGCSKMIGTQRDVYRLTRRNIPFSCRALDAFTDLVQYVAVTASDAARAQIATMFAEYLISSEAQSRLYEIGLFSPLGISVDYGVEQMNSLSKTPPKGVLCALLSRDIHSELVQKDGKKEIFKKFENYIRY